MRIFFENGCKMENIRAFMLVRQIGNLCTCVETWPGDLDKSGEGSGFISENGVFIRFESEHRDEVLESLKKGLFVAECSILQDDQPSAAEESAQQEKQKPEDKGNSGENREAEFLMYVPIVWTACRICQGS